ncbi:MAG TPA: CRISPR-associated endonuclease Cas2 [Spirochaetales bacterium]|nr:CRISPR-associated endonuclease Cas2 [Spirochaetales bacterium]HOV38145.1 CRISPR-associated endonuclease Cas2 [Spirochaetales bacterium]
MNHWLAIYDIRDERRLHKVAKTMGSYGVRVQKSVFEVIASRKVVDRLRNEVAGILDVNEDYVVYFELCERDWQKREKYGPGKYSEEDIRPFQIL